MANVKELRVRIKSVGGIGKITGAMEMVASMKLRKAQSAALSLRPYTAEIQHLIGEAQFKQVEIYLKRVNQVVQVDAFTRFEDAQPARKTAASTTQPAPIREVQS